MRGLTGMGCVGLVRQRFGRASNLLGAMLLAPSLVAGVQQWYQQQLRCEFDARSDESQV